MGPDEAVAALPARNGSSDFARAFFAKKIKVRPVALSGGSQL